MSVVCLRHASEYLRSFGNDNDIIVTLKVIINGLMMMRNDVCVEDDDDIKLKF